jgi:hypothetical protein
VPTPENPAPLMLHFGVDVFFMISSSLVVLSLLAFFVIDCCRGYMAPHEVRAKSFRL